MSMWAQLSFVLWIVVVGAAALFRSRAYAIFRGIILAIQCLVALPLLPHLGSYFIPFIYLHFLTFFDAAVLIRPRLRPAYYRYLFGLPAQYMVASTFMAFPWAIMSAFGMTPWGFELPYLLGLFGLVQSLSARREQRELLVGGVERIPELSRVGSENGRSKQSQRPLRIAQITDPHLGPFMPVARLSAICSRLAAQDPDLVLLTGDFLTMESQRDARDLRDALRPLQALPGRVFACLGNHDHEALPVVLDALAQVGATVLIDNSTVVDTAVGHVQIVGMDFHFRDRREKMGEVCQRHPRDGDKLRLVLLHDPGAFVHLSDGEADLVLSGHTHGGQVGLVSWGGNWTVAGFVAKIPDHGLWGKGTNRMYVHRGTGHYGFPLRLGVPAEESILSVYRTDP